MDWFCLITTHKLFVFFLTTLGSTLSKMRCTWCEETYTRIPQTLKSKQYAWYDACMSYTTLPKKILDNQTMAIYKDYCGGTVHTLPIYTLAVYY